MDESRLNHSLAVARKMVEIGKEYNLNDLSNINQIRFICTLPFLIY